jgi:hypothetical protein
MTEVEMFSEVAVYLLAVAAQPNQHNACVSLNSRDLRHFVSKVEAAGDRNEMNIQLGELASYWMKLCPSDRQRACPEAVRLIANLLKIRSARFTVTSILFDVRDNLKLAKPSIRSAMTDQVQHDREMYDKSYPLIPTTYRMVSKSLACIDKIADTQEVDQVLCDSIVGARSDWSFHQIGK